MKTGLSAEEQSLVAELVADGLSIQDKFRPEPGGVVGPDELTLLLSSASQERRVAFLNALRDAVGTRMPKNKAGRALVSDFDLIQSTHEERLRAWLEGAK